MPPSRPSISPISAPPESHSNPHVSISSGTTDSSRTSDQISSFPTSPNGHSNSSKPGEALNIRLLSFVVLSCFGAAYFGYTSGVIGGCIELPSFHRDFNLPASGTHELSEIASNIVSSIYIGTIVGSLGVIPIAEKYGPRIGLSVSAAIYIGGSAMQTWAGGKLWWMYVGRALAGVGMGGSTSVAPMYISEISPPKSRGFLIGIHEISFQITAVFGFWINYGVNRNLPSTSSAQWMIPLGMQLLPGAILFLSSLLILPESPRHLVRTNRAEKAMNVLSYIRKLDPSHEAVIAEMGEIKNHFDEMQMMTRSQDVGIRGILFSSSAMRKRVGLGCLMMLFLNLTGAVALNSYSPTIFKSLGISSTSSALMLTGMFAIVKCVAVTLSSIFFVDKYGRKVLLLISAVGVSAVMWYLGAFLIISDRGPDSSSHVKSIGAAGYLALACIYIFGFFFCLSSQVPWIYCAEIFPTQFRTSGVSITTTAQFGAEYLVTKASPYMLTNIKGGTFLFFAACTVVMVVWVAYCVPETKGRTLESMETVFTSDQGDVERGVDTLKGQDKTLA